MRGIILSILLILSAPLGAADRILLFGGGAKSASRVLASDSFNRADGALGVTDGLGHLVNIPTLGGAAGAGKVWSFSGLGVGVVGNAMRATAGTWTATRSYGVIDVGATDYIMDARVLSWNNVGGRLTDWSPLRARSDGAGNHVGFGFYDSAVSDLIKYTPTATVLIQIHTGGTNKRYQLVVNGTVFTLYCEKVMVGTPVTITDAVLQTGTKVECGSYYYNGHADWELYVDDLVVYSGTTLEP